MPENPLTPYLTVHDGAAAIEYYKRVFGASEDSRITDPSGRIGHADLTICGARVMLSDEYPEINVRSPKSLGGSAVGLHLYVDDVDTVFARAIEAGAKTLRPVADQSYGDRTGKLQDPFGHTWFIATRIRRA